MSQSFKDLGVARRLIEGITEMGFDSPTPVQHEVIPLLLEKDRDLLVQAQTGTGKTAAFGLPLLMKVDGSLPHLQAVILAPTRELAKQIGKHLFKYTKYSAKVFTEVTAGGDKIGEQIKRLQRPTHILVATPGRLLDLIEAEAVSLKRVKYLILDEADEMLSMGFKKELQEIIQHTGDRRATWLFSATFPKSLEELISLAVPSDTKRVQLNQGQNVVNEAIEHQVMEVPIADKDDFIREFLRHRPNERGLIFCRTRAGAIRLGQELEKTGTAVGVIQGDLSQADRDKIMRAFKKERLQVLVATDVAARGIDVPDLAFVIHHQLPEQYQYYTHRSGRTARAGKHGLSLVLADPRDNKRLKRFAHELGITFRKFRA